MNIREVCRLIKIILLFSPILFFVMFTNYYIDSANVYHDSSKEIAEAIVDGHMVRSLSSNINEREIKRYVIINMPKEVDCIALGPSYIFGLNRETVDEDIFFNLAVSGADLYDILAQLGIMNEYSKKTSRVILCLDTRLFDPDYYNNNVRNESLKPYAAYMQNIITGKADAPPRIGAFPAVKNSIKQLGSLSYFQNCMKYVAETGKYYADSKRYEIINSPNESDGSLFYADGSFSYDKLAEDVTALDVQNNAFQYDINDFFKYDRLDEYGKEQILDIVKYLTDNDVRIDLFMCPVAPALWDRIQSSGENDSIFCQMEEFAKMISNDYPVSLTGSYDPNKYGLSDEDFIDATHLRHSILNSIYKSDL